MTLDEFEDWMDVYTKTWQFDGDMLDLLKHIKSQKFTTTFRAMQLQIKIKLKDVEPHEDRAFLTLKYSELLTIC